MPTQWNQFTSSLPNESNAAVLQSFPSVQLSYLLICSSNRSASRFSIAVISLPCILDLFELSSFLSLLACLEESVCSAVRTRQYGEAFMRNTGLWWRQRLLENRRVQGNCWNWRNGITQLHHRVAPVAYTALSRDMYTFSEQKLYIKYMLLFRYQEELPAAILARPERSLTYPELVKLMEWKLTVSIP